MLKKNASIIYLGLVISKQHGDVMPSSCHSEKMLWNPSILWSWATMAFDHQLSGQMLYCPIYGGSTIGRIQIPSLSQSSTV